ncbi:hypothetical protein CASFOL_013548 [Castilleja foliolosa]|uniref:Dof zinc finger protein n=1 Tax=Castilleja foliolosa TaxID=1961234 RepID=A0ABD3DKA7_9LAMI
MERGCNKPMVELSAPACPRCGSPNTKFCYYNNYSLTQPRYFCKACRRYWTRGGSLRNIPVGGGCRKSRRGKSILKSHNNNINNNYNNISDISTTATTIDLAAVYANFLNQAPRHDHHHNNKNNNNACDYDRVNDHVSLLLSEFSEERVGIMNTPVGFSSFDMNHLSSQANGFFECGHFHEPQLFGNNYSGLPALPGQGILWAPELGSDAMLPGTDDRNMISGALDENVSPFSPLMNLEAIFRS